MRKIIFLLLSLVLTPALFAQGNTSNSNSASRVVTTTTVTTSTSANKVTSGVVTTKPATTIDKEGVAPLVTVSKVERSQRTRPPQRQPCPKQFVCPSNAELERKFDEFVAAYNIDQEEEEKERKASATFREQWDSFHTGWTTWKTSVDGSIAKFTADSGANAYQIAWIQWLFWWGIVLLVAVLFLYALGWLIRAFIRLVRPPDYTVYERRDLPV